MGWTRNLWNIGYPSLTTPTPFKSQKFLLTTEHWVQIYSNQKEIKYISHSNIRASVETRPPKLHNLLQSVSPFHPWHFMSLTPRSFARFPSCILLFTKLVCKLFKVDLVVTFFGSHFRMCLWEMDASTVNSGFRVPVEQSKKSLL